MTLNHVIFFSIPSFYVSLFIYSKITRIQAHGYGGVGLVPSRVPKEDALLEVPGGDDVEHLPLYHALARARARAQTLQNHALLQHSDLHADVPGGEGADLVLLPLHLVLAHSLAHAQLRSLSLAHAL